MESCSCHQFIPVIRANLREVKLEKGSWTTFVGVILYRIGKVLEETDF